MRILLVEDDIKIGTFVVKGLRESGYAVDHCRDGEEGLLMAESVMYDLIVLDLMLPRVDGLSILRELREGGARTPVIVLSAKASVEDRVRGLELGADDYLTKPFAIVELLARIQSLIRRTSDGSASNFIEVGALRVDRLTREVRLGDNRVELQPREFALLEYLMRNAGRVVTKTMILEHVWNYDFDPQTNVVDVLVSRLRNKVDPDKLRIKTIRGVGYVLGKD